MEVPAEEVLYNQVLGSDVASSEPLSRDLQKQIRELGLMKMRKTALSTFSSLLI